MIGIAMYLTLYGPSKMKPFGTSQSLQRCLFALNLRIVPGVMAEGERLMNGAEGHGNLVLQNLQSYGGPFLPQNLRSCSVSYKTYSIQFSSFDTF